MEETEIREGNKFGSHTYLCTAILYMLETKKELGTGAFGEMCVYLQPAAKLCCSTLLDIPIYLKSHCARAHSA